MIADENSLTKPSGKKPSGGGGGRPPASLPGAAGLSLIEDQPPLRPPLISLCIVRQMIHPVICLHKIVVIAQDWPCWLAPALAMNLPLAAVFITKAMQSLFSAREYIPLASIDTLWEVPPDWSSYTVLASGTHEWFSFVSTCQLRTMVAHGARSLLVKLLDMKM